MDPLQSAFAVVVVVVALAPGMVYALVRTTLRGFRADDGSWDSRIAQALLVSLVLDAFYLVAFHEWVTSHLITIGKTSIAIHDATSLGLLLLVLCVLIPGALALMLNLRFRRIWLAGNARRRLRLYLPYRDVPASWDWAFTRATPVLVRIQLPDGRWIGGWFGPGSFVSTYPEPRDVYLSQQYEVDRNGAFGRPIPNTTGVWLTVPDGSIVEFLAGVTEPRAEAGLSKDKDE